MARRVARWPVGVMNEQNEGLLRDGAGQPMMPAAKAGQ